MNHVVNPPAASAIRPSTSTLDFPRWPYFAEDEIQAAVEVLKSGRVNYWTGHGVKDFERAFAAYVGTQYAIAIANGTLALELALIACGIGPGDEVIVPCRTFLATASAVVARGAIPVVADIDPYSQNLSVETLKAVYTDKTRAVIPVHLAGLCCDMDPILEFSKKHGLWVIEDCAQAHGARYKGRLAGSLGDIAAFSFCQDKIMTTAGEGGMLVTHNEDLWEKAWNYKDHGKNVRKIEAEYNPRQSFRWLHDSFGSNYRLTEFQAVIGLKQLEKLDQWVQQRRANAAELTSLLADCPGIEIPHYSNDYYHAYYKFYVYLKLSDLKSGTDRQAIIADIHAAGVPCFGGICAEIQKEKAFASVGLPQETLPQAQRLGDRSVMLLVHPTLESIHMQRCAKVVKEVMLQYAK